MRSVEELLEAWGALSADQLCGTCIAATRMAIEHLRRANPGTRVQPLATKLYAFNPYATSLLLSRMIPGLHQQANHQWIEQALATAQADPENADWHSVAFGISRAAGDELAPNEFDGHVVALIEGRAILDPTLGQLSRPRHGMELGAMLLPVSENWPRGGVISRHLVNGCYLAYEALPAERSFLRSPSWTRTPLAGRDALTLLGQLRGEHAGVRAVPAGNTARRA